MKINKKQIEQLQVLLDEEHDLKLTKEEAQNAGLVIMQFVLVKYQRLHSLNNKKDKI